jgi:hypothetical protein
MLRRHTLLLSALLLGVGAALQRRWIADDAYISFRYARNLVEGQGLVFNPGERVEGFTNLAWTLWLALGLRCGLSAELWSTLWSLAAYVGVIVLLARWPAASGEPRQPALAALVAAGCSALWDYASGGLETMAFTCAVLLTLRLQLAAARADTVRRAAAAGLCGGLAFALRPEGALLVLVLVLVLAARGARGRDLGTRLRAVPAPALGFAAVALPVLAFRLQYYGALLPNTAHAKSAELAWYDQGFAYAGFFFAEHWVLPLGVALWLAAAARPASRARLLPGSGTALLTALLLAWPVLQVGGDFMHGRMWVPLVPLLALVLQAGLLALWPAASRYPGLSAAAVLVATLAARPPAAEALWRRGIVDERTFPDPERNQPGRAETFARFFDGLDVRVAFTGGDARLMYQARVPVALESETGLTDAFVARQPLTRRGRVGHEKPAPLEYLVRQRGAQLTLRKRGLIVLQVLDKLPLVEVRLGEQRAFCLRWDPALMQALAQRGARFTDFPRSLDVLIAELPRRSLPEVQAQYARLKLFYFEHVADPARERPFLDRLALAR